MNFTIKDNNSRIVVGAPLNKYLTDEDISIFSNIEVGRFLSIPWKGLVIGVATNHIPVSAKSGYFGYNGNLASEFQNADCNGKNKIIEIFNIDYIYLGEINCNNIVKINSSKEGFILHKTSI